MPVLVEIDYQMENYGRFCEVPLSDTMSRIN